MFSQRGPSTCSCPICRPPDNYRQYGHARRLRYARWYDPTDGSFADEAGTPFDNTGSRAFARTAANAAGDNDWVLLLESSTIDLHASAAGVGGATGALTVGTPAVSLSGISGGTGAAAGSLSVQQTLSGASAGARRNRFTQKHYHAGRHIAGSSSAVGAAYAERHLQGLVSGSRAVARTVSYAPTGGCIGGCSGCGCSADDYDDYALLPGVDLSPHDSPMAEAALMNHRRTR